MSSITPFFSITVSSSLFTSSKVKPYWNPEQPPPVTNTRSFNSALPSSSISCLTFFAALSVKTNGAATSATAFMSLLLVRIRSGSRTWGSQNRPSRQSHLLALPGWLARRQLELHGLRFRFARAVHQVSLDYGPQVHLQAVVVHVPFDARTRLKFEKFSHVDRTRNLTVHHQMRDADFAFDSRLFAEDQGRGLVGHCRHVADYLTVDAQAPGEIDIALDLGPNPNEAVDPILRLARLLAKHSVTYALRKVDVLAGTGLAGPVLQDACLYGTHLGSRRNPKCSLNSAKVLEVELESSAGRIA